MELVCKVHTYCSEPIEKGDFPEEVFTIDNSNMYLIYDQSGYHIMDDGKEVGLVDEVPDELKDMEIIYVEE